MYSEVSYSSLKNRTYAIPPRRIESCKVLTCSFLLDMDLLQTDVNDCIVFNEQGSADLLTAKIPQGTYTIVNFPDAVSRALSASGSQQYVCTYSDISRRLTISTSGTKDFKILQGSRGTTAYLLMGMSKHSESGYGKAFQMKNTANLSGSYPLLLTSNLNVSGTRWLSDFNESCDSNVLASITPDTLGDIVTWTNSGEFLFCDETVSSLEFHLISSQTMQEVSLNSPLNVTIAFTDDVDDYSSR